MSQFRVVKKCEEKLTIVNCLNRTSQTIGMYNGAEVTGQVCPL